jgi:hypothetical protein
MYLRELREHVPSAYMKFFVLAGVDAPKHAYPYGVCVSIPFYTPSGRISSVSASVYVSVQGGAIGTRFVKEYLLKSVFIITD